MDCVITAKNYLANGYNVLPLRLDGSKAPIGEWRPYQNRFASEHELQEWFGEDLCGIGVITGAISGNLHVIDFDIDAEEYCDRFVADVQTALPDILGQMLVVATPRPGRQVWFRQESEPSASQILAFSEPRPLLDDVGNQLLGDDGQPVMQPVVMIETRGTGAYACAVGTPPETHKTGRPYELLHGSIDALPVLTDADAEKILNICRGYSKFTPQQVQRQSGQPYQGEPRPGDIFNKHADLLQLLLDAGWKNHHDGSGATRYLTRPGKHTAGHSASLGHIRSADGKPLLYVFSSNAAPFQQNQAYDAFATYTHLHHGGDFSTAAAAVRIRYAEQIMAAQHIFHAQIEAHLPEAEPYAAFPVELLPDVVQPYVLEHAAAIGIDPAYVGVPLLAVLAGLIGPARGLHLKRTWQLPSIIWAVTVGDVSSGKTPGWEAATAPANRIEAALHSAMAQRDTDYKKQLENFQQAMKDGDDTASKPIKEKHTDQLTINDATMETLVDIQDRNSKLILSCDELAAWLRGMDQYRSGRGRDVENWLSIYNGGSMQVNRKTDGYRVYLPQTSISVCGTIQPGVATDTLYTTRFIENGFAARILSVQPPSSIVRWSDQEVPDEVDLSMHELADLLYRLPGEQYGTAHRTLMLPCEETAKQLFISWTNDAADHAQSMDSVLRSSWLKLRPMAGRFALVFAVVKQLLHHPAGQATQPVDIESMQAGIQLAWWFGRELERNYAGDDRAALRQHLTWILRKHPNGLDARTLQTGRRSIKTSDDARIIFQKLVETSCGTLNGTYFIPNP